MPDDAPEIVAVRVKESVSIVEGRLESDVVTTAKDFLGKVHDKKKRKMTTIPIITDRFTQTPAFTHYNTPTEIFVQLNNSPKTSNQAHSMDHSWCNYHLIHS